MYGIVKRYFQKQNYGFISTTEGKDYFFHVSGLKDYGGRPYANDHIEFDITEPDEKGNICAYNVKPILTLNMVRKVLRKEHLYLKSGKGMFGNKIWFVVDSDNMIQTSENGMSLEEVAEYAGFTIEKED